VTNTFIARLVSMVRRPVSSVETVRHAPVHVCRICHYQQHVQCDRCGAPLLDPLDDRVVAVHSMPRPLPRPTGLRIAINGGMPKRKEPTP